MTTLADDFDEFFDPILGTFREQIRLSIGSHLVRAYIQGSAQMISYGKTLLGKSIVFEGPPVRRAIDWAQEHATKLVTRMDEETKKRLAQAISEGIENKRGIEGLARDIRGEFDNMTKYRSKLIAQTETNDALSQAFMDRADDLGITGKEWVVIGDDRTCEICNGNEAEGIVPIDHVFSSGHTRPPGHPGCRCSLAPAMLRTKAGIS